MNKLKFFDEMGLNVTWKLIYIGLIGQDEIPPILSYSEIVEYLYEILGTDNSNLKTDQIVSIVCEKDNAEKGCKILKGFCDVEKTDAMIQKQKWLLYMLNGELDKIGVDYLQGILQLWMFWYPIRNTITSPISFPEKDNDIQRYFSQTTYDELILTSRKWIETTRRSIINAENETNIK